MNHSVVTFVTMDFSGMAFIQPTVQPPPASFCRTLILLKVTTRYPCPPLSPALATLVLLSVSVNLPMNLDIKVLKYCPLKMVSFA